ncbi:MAG: hypothetical protein A3F70_16555 [Acidobacteria bacterium RIFCSPLOWO2_12_FULL_67_14]|nr:MAG: hypothetical protein A3F70_16555 [Acidobacteria bacterium RIFCSPLOWO2_12_FULL_67_14]
MTTNRRARTRIPLLQWLFSRRQVLASAALLVLSSGPAAAQGAAITHIEENDPAILYSGNWYTNESAAHRAGTAALTNARGARATISFTGTGIAWVGVADGWAGLATVHLDGAMTIVNSYSEEGRYQDPRYDVHGLSAGPHTLTIEVTHERAEHTEGSWVWIDGFDIENGAPLPGGLRAENGHVEENHPALVYTGRWYSNESPLLGSGRALLATDAGASMSIGFNGAGINWISYRDEWSGVARVFIDGELKATVDTYRSPAKALSVSYSVAALTPGAHVLTIEVTGIHNESSKGAWIWVDGFDVLPAP